MCKGLFLPKEMIKKLVKDIKRIWKGNTIIPVQNGFTVNKVNIYPDYHKRKLRLERVSKSYSSNCSTKNRMIRSIKTSNKIASGIYFQNCTDFN
jgi:hypothetical protein